MPTAERADGALTGHSEVLGLELRLYPDDRFRFHDPASGQDLLSHDETDAAWQQEAQARKEAESRLERTESRLQESEAARRALEAQIRDLRRRMRGRAQEPDDLGR